MLDPELGLAVLFQSVYKVSRKGKNEGQRGVLNC